MENILECHICSNEYLEAEYVVPLIISNCGHTICQQCVEDMMKEHNEEFWEITCPFCINVTFIPEGDTTCLKKNYLVMEIVRSMKQSNRVDEPPVAVPDGDPLNPILQEKCAEDDSHQAVFYCSSCRMNFCESCWRRAHRMQSFSSHEPTPIAEKPPICADHPDQVTELICVTPDCNESSRLICKSCYMNQRHVGHRIEKFTAALFKFREELKVALERTEHFKLCIRDNKKRIEEIEETHHMHNIDFELKAEKIDEYFEQILSHVKLAQTEAHVELKRVSDHVIGCLEIMKDHEDEKLRIEEFTTTEIQHLLSQDIGVLMEKKKWIQKLATRNVNIEEPMLPDPMSQLQICFPPLPHLEITIEPVHRLLGGIIHGHQTGETNMFQNFLNKKATPGEEPNRYIYKDRVLEIADVGSYRGQLLRSMIHVQVTPESSEHLITLINEYLATCVPHLIPDSPTLTFERIIVGVLHFKGIRLLMKALTKEFERNPIFQFVIIDKETGIEKMFGAAIGI